MCERLASREVTPGLSLESVFLSVRARNLPRPRSSVIPISWETCLKKFILISLLFTLLSRRSQAAHGSLPSAACFCNAIVLENKSGISGTTILGIAFWSIEPLLLLNQTPARFKQFSLKEKELSQRLLHPSRHFPIHQPAAETNPVNKRD